MRVEDVVNYGDVTMITRARSQVPAWMMDDDASYPLLARGVFAYARSAEAGARVMLERCLHDA